MYDKKQMDRVGLLILTSVIAATSSIIFTTVQAKTTTKSPIADYAIEESASFGNAESLFDSYISDLEDYLAERDAQMQEKYGTQIIVTILEKTETPGVYKAMLDRNETTVVIPDNSDVKTGSKIYLECDGEKIDSMDSDTVYVEEKAVLKHFLDRGIYSIDEKKSPAIVKIEEPEEDLEMD